MATASKIKPDPEAKVVELCLTNKEAQLVRVLVGNITGGGPVRRIANEVYNALYGALGSCELNLRDRMFNTLYLETGNDCSAE